jgi:hypothetical protein
MPAKKKAAKKTSCKKLLIHEHQYGISHAVIDATGFSDGDFLLDDEQFIKLAKLCGLNYEPHKDETISIVDLDEGITKIKREQLYYGN